MSSEWGLRQGTFHGFHRPVFLIFCLLCEIGLILYIERDAFDTLFDHAPDKLNVVKKVSIFPYGPLFKSDWFSAPLSDC